MTPSRLKVLALANRLPFPLDDGWKVRTFQLLRQIGSRHDVRLVVMGETADRAYHQAFCEAAPAVTLCVAAPPRLPLAANLLLGAVTPEPVHVWRMRSREMRAEVAMLAQRERFDVALLTYTFMYQYVSLLPQGMRRIVDTHNIDSTLLRRYLPQLRGTLRSTYARITARKVHQLEQRVFREASQLWVCSAEEVAEVHRRVPGAAVRHVPNGVDVRHFSSVVGSPGLEGRMLFFGKLDYFPNLDALRVLAEAVWPAIRARAPHAVLEVAGAGDARRARELVEGLPGLVFSGQLPDIREALARAQVVLVPLRAGGGTRLKIIEAMAAGRSVVATHVGAEGLGIAPGQGLVIVSDMQEFVEQAVRLCGDAPSRSRLGRQAREIAVARFDWDGIGRCIDSALEDCMGQAARR